jgi:glutamyl/glutaminyl-tRNA synthetase
MEPLSAVGTETRRPSPFTREDVRAIVERRGWLPPGNARDTAASTAPDASESARSDWLEQAAQLLGAQSPDAHALESLLERVFEYDARKLLGRAENQAVMAREGARHVLRELAALVLDSPEVDSERYKEIVAALKERTGRRGQELFHPLRLALAGRAGEGEFDRVVLLLDAAARLSWAVAVKGCRQRMIEFCGVLD